MKINWSAVGRIVGYALLLFSAVLFVPLLTAFGNSEYYCVRGFVLVILFSLALGTSLRKLILPSTKPLLVREGFLIVVIIFTLLPLLSTVPFMLSGKLNAFEAGTEYVFTDAFCEAVSGITATGATMIDNVASLPRSIIIFRAILQWFGSLSMIALAMVFLSNLGLLGSNIDTSESQVSRIQEMTPTLKSKASFLLAIYLSFTALEFVLFLLSGLSPLESIVYAFTTISTGGFTASSLYVSQLPAFAKIVMMLFMILGSMNFIVYYQIYKWKNLKAIHDIEISDFFSGILVSITLISIAFLLAGGRPEDYGLDALNAIFQVVSMATTTGFASCNISIWPSFCKCMLLILMSIGACTVSSGSGVKVARSIITVKYLNESMANRLHTNEISRIKYNGKLIRTDVITNLISFLLLYFAFLIIGSLCLAASGLEFEYSFSAVISCLNNAGLSTASLVGPAYLGLPFFAKWVLIAEMLAGKMEIFALIIVFTKKFRNMDSALK